MSLSGNSIFLKDFHYLGKISLMCVKKWIANTAWKVSILGVFLVEIRENKDRKTPNVKSFHAVKVFRFWPILCWYSNLFQYFPVFYNLCWNIERNWNVCTKWVISHHLFRLLLYALHKKMKFSIKEFFSICEQTRKKLQIWPHLLKKLLMENFIFWCSV